MQLGRFVSALLAMPAFSLVRFPEVFADAYTLLVNTAWIMLAWSLVDYLVEWRQWESRLKMSKQEMREEFKETEGNPQMKGRIRSLQRQMRRRMLRADVKKASVVITNPTHYAVALAFDIATMEAPKVLAKGRDLLAAQIREEARWAGVPLVENPPLARSLYRSVEPGQSIPAELYSAVAAILAYLFRQEAEERMRSMHEQRRASRQGSGSAPSASEGGMQSNSDPPASHIPGQETI
jgi:flagellar biosynthetic protein FlhB